MRFKIAALTLLLTLGSLGAVLPAAEQPWTFMPIEDIGTRTFLDAHPEYDGRGVIVAVLDTGVDMTVPGLLETSLGGTKVIDVRDFTGQGEIELQSAEWTDDGRLKIDDTLQVEGFDQLAIPAVSEDRVWTGLLEESRFRNSAVDDLDDDGDEDGRWAIVVYEADRETVVDALGEGAGVELRRGWGEAAVEAEDEAAARETVWLCVVDLDADTHLDDEDIRRDYATDFDHFTMQDPDNEEARAWLGIGLDLTGDDEPALNLHFDDGGHGSHCGGIAAGNDIHGQAGMDGVAPGAWIVSCKLGDNSLSGGATRTDSMKKAYEYVGHLAKTYEVPVVVNMSYGIGSEIEGDASMEKWLDDFLDDHSSVVICHSAGNSGPGLSSIGTPAAADGVIVSGALLTKEVARDLYGAPYRQDHMFGFSSRGGEVAKPDVATPGVASSSVPLWSHYDRYNGTSMASPQTTGAVACILSGLVQRDLGWNFGTIQRSLQATARPLEGYSRIAAGAGVLYLPDAFEAAVDYAEAGEDELVTVYRVRTEAPGQEDGEAPAAYWRAGGWFPAAPLEQEFTVEPRFATDVTEDQRNQFYRAFRLKSDVDWIRIDRDETYINGDTEREIGLSYDASKLREPGLHVGTVLGTVKGSSRGGAAEREFELVVSIIVPREFTVANDYSMEFEGRELDPGALQREFVRVPTGASSMEVVCRVPEGEEGSVRTVLHDPEGRRFLRGGFAESEGPRERRFVVAGDDLRPGTWEVVNRADMTTDTRSTYDLGISFSGLHSRPEEIAALDFDAPGEAPTAAFEVVNRFSEPFEGTAAGSVDHWRRERNVEVEGSVFTYDFTVDETIAAVEFEIELTGETYNRMTDCAVNIMDSEGVYAAQSGLGQRFGDVSLSPASPGGYTLEVVAAFSLPDDAESWSLDLVERFELAEPVALSVTQRGETSLRVVPDVPATLEIEAAASPVTAPSGFVNAGEVRLVDDDTGGIRLRVPVRLP